MLFSLQPVILCLYAHIIFEILTFLRWFGFTGNRFKGASKLFFFFFANKSVFFFYPFYSLQGILYQAGDVVSIEDIEGDLYYAQLRGFLQDQYAQKTAVITWLIPMVPKPSHFDPALFLPGNYWKNVIFEGSG